MNNQLASIVPSIVALGFAAAVALFLTLSRQWAEKNEIRLRSAVQIAILSVVFQAIHFAEEFLTGFHEQFPALFGLPPMSLRFFVTFNVVWLVIWSLSIWGLSIRVRIALFPLWFLGVACVLNGVAHPLMAVFAGGYFPGLATSPVVGVMGVFLLRGLLGVTRN